MMKIVAVWIIFVGLVYASVGKITIVRGEVIINRQGNVIQAHSGTKIDEHDEIITKAGASAQIVFDDATVITVGANTVAKVAEYLYDGDKSKASFNVTQGIFKAITGKIGKINPNKFQLKTKSSTIGIRGTNFRGMIPLDHTEPEKIACTQGAITVTPLFANAKPVVVMAGFMTTVSTKSIEPPKPYMQGDLTEMDQAKSIPVSSSTQEQTNNETQTSTQISVVETKQETNNMQDMEMAVSEPMASPLQQETIPTTSTMLASSNTPMDSMATQVNDMKKNNELDTKVEDQKKDPTLTENKEDESEDPTTDDATQNQDDTSDDSANTESSDENPENGDDSSDESLPNITPTVPSVNIVSVEENIVINQNSINNSNTLPVFVIEADEVRIGDIQSEWISTQNGLYFLNMNNGAYFDGSTPVRVDIRDSDSQTTTTKYYHLNSYKDHYSDTNPEGVNLDDYSSWGYWAISEVEREYYTMDDGDNYGEIADRGYWLVGQKTPNETIQSFITNNHTYTYTGHILGNLMHNGYRDSIVLDQNNVMKFDVAFGTANPINLKLIKFNTLNEQSVNVEFNNNTTSAINTTNYTFSADAVSANTQNTIAVRNGTFFGPNAESSGGSWSGSFNNGSLSGTGVFKANKN